MCAVSLPLLYFAVEKWVPESEPWKDALELYKNEWKAKSLFPSIPTPFPSAHQKEKEKKKEEEEKRKPTELFDCLSRVVRQ